jgi:hypothetical protein
MTESPKPRRRWFQISLRTLMLLVVVASLPFAWGSYKIREARKRREAVDIIRQLGAKIEIQTKGPDWARRIFGDELFTDATTFEAKQYGGAEVTDRSMSYFGLFSRLRYVNLCRTGVTDAGLLHLRNAPELDSLYLLDDPISDAGLVYVPRFTELQYLTLEGTRITDAGMMHLRGLAKLRSLNLRKTKVSDTGLAHLTELRSLVLLELDDTRVTNAGLIHLQNLPELQCIYLCRTEVTDDGLNHLAKIPRLDAVFVIGTKVTSTGAKELKAAKPGLRIWRKKGVEE